MQLHRTLFFHISVLAGLTLIAGCGPRVQVAKDKINSKIDRMLGDVEVKRAAIQSEMDGLKSGLETMRQTRIKAEVKLEQLGKKTKPVNDRIAKIDAALGQIRQHLGAKEEVEINGKKYQPAEVQKMAQELIDQRKALSAEVKNLSMGEEGLKRSVSMLTSQRKRYENKLKQLASQVAEIDAKKTALDALKESSAAMGGNYETLASNVEELEGKVEDLFVDVEASLRAEEEKWDEAEAENTIESVDRTLEALASPQDTAAEIDAILSGGKNKEE